MLVSGRMPWSVTCVSPLTWNGIDPPLEATLLGRLGGELVGAEADLI